MPQILKEAASAWKTLLVITMPIVLLPLPLTSDLSEVKCLYGLIVMSVFWITEALPLAVTALLPVLIFPLLGVVKVGDVCATYTKNTSMFVLGGLSISVAIEKWHLHKRIALRSLLFFGSEPKWLMFGFMCSTWFLSMWVNNTACTAMMLPIVSAVLSEIKQVNRDTGKDKDEAIQLQCDITDGSKSLVCFDTAVLGDNNEILLADITTKTSTLGAPQQFSTGVKDGTDKAGRLEDARYNNMCKGMLLCVAYAASIGGIGTLSGSSTNLVAESHIEIVYERNGETSPINFATWMVFGVPLSLITLILCWLWLQLIFLGRRELVRCRRKKTTVDHKIAASIRHEYSKLGPMSFAEGVVLVHFVVLVVLWISRQPPMVTGWGSIFPEGYVKDSVAAIFICISLFVAPSERPVFCRSKSDFRPRVSVPAILDWQTVEKSFPWGVLLLFGGGYALADACETSGLSKLISKNLTGISHLEPLMLVFVLTIATTMLTEVTSNNATATLLMPILASLAQALKISPIYLMLPCAVATSFAFMLPVATPPNAIVFATGHLRILDMVKAGIGMNVICVLVLLFATNTWGEAFFHFSQVPASFAEINATLGTLNTTA